MIVQTIDFKNFQPTEKLRNVVQDTLEKVYAASPGSSDVNIKIEKNNRAYSAYGTVDTPQGVYVGYSGSKRDVYDCVHEMGMQLEGRLVNVRRRGMHDVFKKTS